MLKMFFTTLIACLGLVYYNLAFGGFLLDAAMGIVFGILISRRAQAVRSAAGYSLALAAGFAALFVAVRLMASWPLDIAIPVGTLLVTLLIARIDYHL